MTKPAHVLRAGLLSMAACAAVVVSAGQQAPIRNPTLAVVHKSGDALALMDLDTGATVSRIAVGFAPHEASASPDRTSVVVSNYGTADKPGSTVTIVDLAARSVVRTISLAPHTRPHGVSWYAANRIAVTTEGSGHLVIVDPLAGSIVGAVATGQEVSHQVAVQPGGQRAFVANIRSGSITAIDLAAMRRLADIKTGDGAEGIAVSPDGKHVWVTNRAADSVSVVDATALRVLATVPVRGFPIRVALTPDGRRALISCAVTGEVVAIDTATRREVGRRLIDIPPVADAAARPLSKIAPGKAMPIGLLVTPDGRSAYVALTMADTIAVLDPATLAVVRTVPANGEPDGMAFVGRR